MLSLADNFLAGSLLSLLLPACLLIAIAVWYAIAVRRYGGSRAAEHLPPEVVPPADMTPPVEGQPGSSPS